LQPGVWWASRVKNSDVIPGLRAAQNPGSILIFDPGGRGTFVRVP